LALEQLPTRERDRGLGKERDGALVAVAREKSKGALILNLPRGLSPPEAIAAAVSSISVSNAPVRS